jgi:hypothetical protein
MFQRKNKPHRSQLSSTQGKNVKILALKTHEKTLNPEDIAANPCVLRQKHMI